MTLLPPTLPAPSPQRLPLIPLIVLAIASQDMLLLVVLDAQRALLPARRLAAGAAPAALGVVVIELVVLVLVAAAGERIVQLAAAGALLAAGARVAAPAGAAETALLAGGREALGLLLVEELELVAVAGGVAEAAAAREVQVDAQTGAEGEDEREGGVDPGLGARGDTEGGEEAGQPRGGGRAACGGLLLASGQGARGLGVDGPVGVIRGRGAGEFARGVEARGRRDGRRWDGGGRDHVVIVIILLGGHGQLLGELRVDGLAPKLQVPVGPGAVVVVGLGILDDDGPGALSRFTPGCDGQS